MSKLGLQVKYSGESDEAKDAAYGAYFEGGAAVQWWGYCKGLDMAVRRSCTVHPEPALPTPSW